MQRLSLACALLLLAGCDATGPDGAPGRQGSPGAPARVEVATFAPSQGVCSFNGGNSECDWEWPAVTAGVIQTGTVFTYWQAAGETEWRALPYVRFADVNSDGSLDQESIISGVIPGFVGLVYQRTGFISTVIPGRLRAVAFTEAPSAKSAPPYATLAALYDLPLN